MAFADKMQTFILKRHGLAKKFFSKTSPDFWTKKGQSKALNTFRHACATSAYSNILKKNKVDPDEIKTFEDFQKLPIIDKKSYVYANETKDLYVIPPEEAKMFYVSSGTAGKVTFWPKDAKVYKTLDLLFDFLFCHYFDIDNKLTLVINTFSLGVYASGMSMALIGRYLAENHRITITNPGTDIENTMIILENIGKYYDQIILCIYPSFLRTLIEEFRKREFSFGKSKVVLFCAAEPTTANYREYLKKEFNIKDKDLFAFFDVFGTSECGTPGIATPFTNLLYEKVRANKKLASDLFGNKNLIPQIFQNNPASVFTEEIDNELVFTYDSEAPIVRYNIHDRGGIIPFERFEKILEDHRMSIDSLLQDYKLSPDYVFKWPIIYLYGRNDAVIIGGGNIFPEDIEAAIIKRENKEIYSFKLEIKELEDMTQKFVVHLELKPGLKIEKHNIGTLKMKYHDLILNRLLKVDQDYAISYKTDPRSADPEIIIHEYLKGPFKDDYKKQKERFIICR